jgi:hypothetical protein
MFADYRAVTGAAVLGGGSLYYDTLGNFYGGVTFWLSQACSIQPLLCTEG